VRLAVLLQHPRNHEAPPNFSLSPTKKGLTVTFPKGWLDDRPLTTADLENERDYLTKQDFDLQVVA
jgi:exopolyphosphatase/guanosine-5'-triphosphate,3'-diphosphate pyrophosphatase